MNLDELKRYLDVEEDESIEEDALVSLVPKLVQSQPEPVAEPEGAATMADRMHEIELALKLGYLLCKCSWPPQIMVLTGTDHVYRCRRCSRVREI